MNDSGYCEILTHSIIDLSFAIRNVFFSAMRLSFRLIRNIDPLMKGPLFHNVISDAARASVKLIKLHEWNEWIYCALWLHKKPNKSQLQKSNSLIKKNVLYHNRCVASARTHERLAKGESESMGLHWPILITEDFYRKLINLSNELEPSAFQPLRCSNWRCNHPNAAKLSHYLVGGVSNTFTMNLSFGRTST